MLKIMIVDDHELVRTGLSRMLQDVRGLEVIAEAASGEEAIELAREDEPDVVLMDLRMPGMGGLEATKKLVRYFDAIKVIAVTAYEEEPFPSRVLQAGAVGYVTKGAGIDEMVRAIRVVKAGQHYISPHIAQAMALKAYTGTASPMEVLSERELQVMTLIINCHKVQEIADQLYLSPKTVNTYRYRIYEKLGVESDVEMTILAIRHGMVDVGLIDAIE
ncbi:MAG TPA: UvrY/SirA/GacA family response regulator transcription factor [Alcanivoracaceae bacterium]|nr:UvrY/SirA/GacA family response regulator transcription factor [Alcanivoracaceae bacterium]